MYNSCWNALAALLSQKKEENSVSDTKNFSFFPTEVSESPDRMYHISFENLLFFLSFKNVKLIKNQDEKTTNPWDGACGSNFIKLEI